MVHTVKPHRPSTCSASPDLALVRPDGYLRPAGPPQLVSIEGEAEQARFKFHWQEREGPSVVVPARTGFGSVLLEKLASQDFGAQPAITFAPHGLSYSIDASLLTLTAGNQRTNLLRSSDYAVS
jgi:hypothetical protein